MFRNFAIFIDRNGNHIAVRANLVVGVYIDWDDDEKATHVVIVTNNTVKPDNDDNTEWYVSNSFDEVMKELEVCNA